jgi:uncharacterized protein YlxP (DUF503 family)
VLHIAILTLRFHLEGCTSLKEKRQRLIGLRDRFGRLPNMAVCETDRQDSLQHAEWTFIAAATARPVTDQMIAEVEKDVAETVDARVYARELEHV